MKITIEKLTIEFDFLDNKKEETIDKTHYAEISILKSLLAKPTTRAEATSFLTITEIMKYLNSCVSKELSIKRVGEALNYLQFEKFQKIEGGQTKWVYSVVKKRG